MAVVISDEFRPPRLLIGILYRCEAGSLWLHDARCERKRETRIRCMGTVCQQNTWAAAARVSTHAL
jgi:hypothetical protein